MSWLPDKREWHIYFAKFWDRIPEVGVDGKVLRPDPREIRIMRRILNGEKQYRAPTQEELERDTRDWVDGMI